MFNEFSIGGVELGLINRGWLLHPMCDENHVPMVWCTSDVHGMCIHDWHKQFQELCACFAKKVGK